MTVRLDRASGQIHLVGRLDRGTASVLHDAVSALLEDDSPCWTVDVRLLVVADHSGLRAIGRTYRRALRHGCQLRLQGCSPSLRAALLRLRLGPHVLLDDQVPA